VRILLYTWRDAFISVTHESEFKIPNKRDSHTIVSYCVKRGIVTQYSHTVESLSLVSWTLIRVSHLWMRHVTYGEGFSHNSILLRGTRDCHILLSHSTGWRRLIGSRKLQIIFHKRATKCGALLLKMTYKDKGSYEFSPPCSVFSDCPVVNCCMSVNAHGGDQTSSIRISRLHGFLV